MLSSRAVLLEGPLLLSHGGISEVSSIQFVTFFDTGAMKWSPKKGLPEEGSLLLLPSSKIKMVENGFFLECSTKVYLFQSAPNTSIEGWVSAISTILRRIGGVVQVQPYNVKGVLFDICSKYRPIQAIGQGTFGLVISAENSKTGELVAVKKIERAFDDLVDGKRFVREIYLMKHLRHPNLLELKDVLRPTNPQQFSEFYLVTGLMDSNLHRVINSKQPLTEAHIKCFMYQIFCGLRCLHQAQVLHRDLKPENVLVNANCHIKICDFGLSRGTASGAALTEYVVTRWYRAPEVMLCPGQYGAAVDLWSAGCVLGELLLGRPLFQGRDQTHQLEMIMRVLGSPAATDRAHVTSAGATAFLERHQYSQVPLQRLFPSASEACLHLLKALLQWNPSQRPSAASALTHPFFADIGVPPSTSNPATAAGAAAAAAPASGAATAGAASSSGTATAGRANSTTAATASCNTAGGTGKSTGGAVSEPAPFRFPWDYTVLTRRQLRQLVFQQSCVFNPPAAPASHSGRAVVSHPQKQQRRRQQQLLLRQQEQDRRAGAWRLTRKHVHQQPKHQVPIEVQRLRVEGTTSAAADPTAAAGTAPAPEGNGIGSRANRMRGASEMPSQPSRKYGALSTTASSPDPLAVRNEAVAPVHHSMRTGGADSLTAEDVALFRDGALPASRFPARKNASVRLPPPTAPISSSGEKLAPGRVSNGAEVTYPGVGSVVGVSSVLLPQLPHSRC